MVRDFKSIKKIQSVAWELKIPQKILEVLQEVARGGHLEGKNWLKSMFILSYKEIRQEESKKK
jgi:hypothetical protein